MEIGNKSLCTNCMDFVTYTTKIVREKVKYADGNYYTYDENRLFATNMAKESWFIV